MDKAMKPYIGLCDILSKKQREIFNGSKNLVMLLGGWGVLIASAGALAKSAAMYLIVGAAAIEGVAGILWSLGKMLPTFFDLCETITKKWRFIFYGSSRLIILLGGWGTLITALGAVATVSAPLMLAGGAAIEGIATILYSLGKMLPSYIKTSELVASKWNVLKDAGKKIPQII